MKKIYIFLFALIFIVGIVFRIYDIGRVPNSLNWDEVSWGYNAFSILKTGHDEHGAFMPLSFEAFGDFKQPVYVYLASITVGLFGLTPLAVRLPSAVLGILTIPFVWLLVYEYFKEERYRLHLALLVMLFFSLSPWSIQFSRVAYEANVGLFFTVAGVALFIRGLNVKKPFYIPISLLLLSLSCYTYHSQKLFTPLLVVGLLFYSYFSFKVSKRFILTVLGLFILFNLLWVIDPRTTSRGRSVAFYSNQTEILKSSTQKMIYDSKRGDIFGEIIENRRLVYIDKYLENYLSHFNPNYLFITGDNARHHTFGMGVLILVSLPLILVGLTRLNARKLAFILFWFFAAPIASSLAVDAPNASRSLVFLPTWYIFEALGVVAIFSIKRISIKKALFAVVACMYLLNYLYFAHNYFMHTNDNYGIYWQSGYKEAILRSREYEKEGIKVFFSESFEQAYIFYLFYNEYSPAKYIAEGGSSRIKNQCFNIEIVYFGNCSSKLQKGDILMSNKDEKATKLRKIGTIDGQSKGSIYEVL